MNSASVYNQRKLRGDVSSEGECGWRTKGLAEGGHARVGVAVVEEGGRGGISM